MSQGIGEVLTFAVGVAISPVPIIAVILRAWLVLHNDAVMTVLFLVFGVKLIADAIPPLVG